MQANKTNLDNLVEKIANYKGHTSFPYIQKFTKNWISNIIEESDAIKTIEKKFMEYGGKGLDVYDFTRVFLNILPHAEDETLYLTIALIDLFKNICDTYALDKYVKSYDILNYIVENFLNKNNKAHIIQTKKLPDQRKFNTDANRVREIDMEAPVVHGGLESSIKRLNKSKITSDSTHHNNNGIKKACFGTEVRKLFTLDSLADNICVFNLNCILDTRIVPKPVDSHKEVMILDFAWSNTQKRIGATFKDCALSFWEANDNYEFEKNFSTATIFPDYQARIWYIGFLGWWITTDKTHSLHVWDIEKEKCVQTLSSPLIQGNIVEVVTLDVVKLVAVGSLDKIVTIWNLQKGRVLMKFDVSEGGVHTMVWSDVYKILLSAGYDSKIKVWDVDQTSQDTSMIGKLVGHPSSVCAIEFVEGSPIVVSADVTGHLKVWDIRTLTCVQSLNIDVPTISKLIDISKFGKLAFIGNRLNMLNFEDLYSQLAPLKHRENMWPVQAEYDASEDQIVLATKKDIRFIDTQTGRVRKIYVGLLEKDENDITIFKLTHQNKKFMLGDDKGYINIFNTTTGESIKALSSHQHEVTAIKFDYVNNLIISAGGDSQIQIQKETKTTFEVQRTIKNLHYNKEIALMEASVYHNVILTASGTNSMYILDYEYAKILAELQTSPNSEPTVMHFINGFAVIIIADTLGKIHFVLFKRRDIAFISFYKIGEIDITQSISESTAGSVFATKILVDLEEKDKIGDVSNCNMYISTNKGLVLIYNILDIIRHKEVKYLPHANTRSSYNCNRILEEDFLRAVEHYKFPVFELDQSDKVQPFITADQSMCIPLQLNDKLVRQFKAHNDNLTTLSISPIAGKRLITTSLDLFIKIWTLDGQLLGSLNINHPLPTKWNLKTHETNHHIKKIFYALKVVDTILQKNRKNMFFDEEKKVSVNQFLHYLNSNDSKPFPFKIEGGLQVAEIDPLGYEDSKPKHTIVMKDEYSPRDIQYDKVKQFYQKELQGTTLKQMEFNKRLSMNQKAMNFRAKEVAAQKIEAEERKERQEEEVRVRQEFISFLVEDARSAFFEQKERNDLISSLSSKLDGAVGINKKPERIELTPQPSKPSLSTIPKRRFIREKDHIVTDTQETLNGNTFYNLKMYLNSDEDIGNLVCTLQNTCSIASNITSKPIPSITPVDSSSRLKKNKDFYVYAKRKLDTEEYQSLPILSGTFSREIPEVRSEAFDRRIKKKNFHDILVKLDQRKKRSQLDSNSVFRSPGLSTLVNTTPFDNSKLIQQTPQQPEQEKEPSLLPYKSFVENQRATKGIKPFTEELTELKKYVQRSWSLNKSEGPKTKVVFNNVQRMISQKSEFGKETNEDPSRKVQGILRDWKKDLI